MRDLRDQSHANWIKAYQGLVEEWAMEALCGESGCLFWMGRLVAC